MPKRKKPRKKKKQQRAQSDRLCVCGSGKLAKDCHGEEPSILNIKPDNKPEVIDYYMTSPDGENWTRRPGNLLVMIGGRRPEDIDENIESLIGPWIKRAEEASRQDIRDRLFDLRHKLYAVCYHLKTIKVEIEKQVEEFQKQYKAGAGAYQQIENPRLVYETEAFLFQVKSSLDILVQVIGRCVPPLSSMHSFRSANIDGDDHAGGSVIRALRLNSFPELGDNFESHRSAWIQELVRMRDTITHYSGLKDFHCFIEEPYRGGETVTIHYPSMPSGKRVDEYCEYVFDLLLSQVKESIALCPPPLGSDSE